MRWILPVVLLAACAGAFALPTADPPATDGLIGQPALGWKLDWNQPAPDGSGKPLPSPYPDWTLVRS